MTFARTIHAPAVARDRHGLAAFAGGLRGAAFWPGDAEYDEACRIWNAMIERRPALAVRPRGAADVAACIAFARDSGLPLSIRGGGHNIAGTALCDGGVMIDFSTHKDVEVDAATGRVRVQPGATWADVDRATQPFGLVVPGGIVSATGVAGFTLGGGFGWVSRRHGFAADNLRAVEIVTADGAGAPGERRGEPRSVLGDPRRRRQLRRGHGIRVRGAAARPRGGRRPRAAPGWRGPRRCWRCFARRRPRPRTASAIC